MSLNSATCTRVGRCSPLPSALFSLFSALCFLLSPRLLSSTYLLWSLSQDIVLEYAGMDATEAFFGMHRLDILVK
jgi:hypothetical protein